MMDANSCSPFSVQYFHAVKAATGVNRLIFACDEKATRPRSVLDGCVRINDRGPFVKGRIINVSRHAAEVLGIVGAGLARVKVEIVH
jgi:rare lipoprotein A